MGTAVRGCRPRRGLRPGLCPREGGLLGLLLLGLLLAAVGLDGTAAGRGLRQEERGSAALTIEVGGFDAGVGLDPATEAKLVGAVQASFRAAWAEREFYVVRKRYIVGLRYEVALGGSPGAGFPGAVTEGERGFLVEALSSTFGAEQANVELAAGVPEPGVVSLDVRLVELAAVLPGGGTSVQETLYQAQDTSLLLFDIQDISSRPGGPTTFDNATAVELQGSPVVTAMVKLLGLEAKEEQVEQIVYDGSLKAEIANAGLTLVNAARRPEPPPAPAPAPAPQTARKKADAGQVVGALFAVAVAVAFGAWWVRKIERKRRARYSAGAVRLPKGKGVVRKGGGREAEMSSLGFFKGQSAGAGGPTAASDANGEAADSGDGGGTPRAHKNTVTTMNPLTL